MNRPAQQNTGKEAASNPARLDDVKEIVRATFEPQATRDIYNQNIPEEEFRGLRENWDLILYEGADNEKLSNLKMEVEKRAPIHGIDQWFREGDIEKYRESQVFAKISPLAKIQGSLEERAFVGAFFAVFNHVFRKRKDEYVSIKLTNDTILSYFSFLSGKLGANHEFFFLCLRYHFYKVDLSSIGKKASDATHTDPTEAFEGLTSRGTERRYRVYGSTKTEKIGARVPIELRDEWVQRVEQLGMTQTRALEEALIDFLEKTDADEEPPPP